MLGHLYVVRSPSYFISGCVQIAIFLAHFACGLTAPHALKAVQLQPGSVVVAWEVQGKQGYHCSSSWE